MADLSGDNFEQIENESERDDSNHKPDQPYKVSAIATEQGVEIEVWCKERPRLLKELLKALEEDMGLFLSHANIQCHHAHVIVHALGIQERGGDVDAKNVEITLSQIIERWQSMV